MHYLGIDLGTTNSACSVWSGGQVQIIPNRLGESLTPSVVHIGDNGLVEVGKTAKEKLILHPDRTASLFKRYMGTDRKFTLNSRVFSAPELSAFVLRSLKEDAESFLEEPVTEAILSVPAYFNDAQRKATALAADLAGLKLKRLINEPTAAAIAYGVHERPEHNRFIVIDLGGGTFDVSIVEYFNGVLEVHASAGDNFLGGEDFLELLVLEYLRIADVQRQTLNSNELQKVYQQMELAKRALNSALSFEVPPFLKAHHEAVEIKFTTFEELSEPLLRRILITVETALRDAELEPSDLDDILLVGGATRMKLLRASVTRMFRKFPSANLNPDEVVAIGAGIQAGLVARDAALDDVVLTDVCPYTLGIGIHNENDKTGLTGAVFDPIIERNTTVPVSREEVYSSVVDNQSEINITIYQGESRLVQDNIQLGLLDVRIPTNEAGEEKIAVRFSYDINGLLEVDVKILSTGETLNRVIQNAPGSLTEDQIRLSREKLSAMKFHPRDEEVNRELVARAERLYEARLGDEREAILEFLTKFESIVESQDLKRIELARSEFESLLEYFETPLF
jgi:molecular chaperone HscC